MYTVAEAAKKAGCSVPTIYNAIKAEKLKKLDMPEGVRINEIELTSWLESRHITVAKPAETPKYWGVLDNLRTLDSADDTEAVVIAYLVKGELCFNIAFANEDFSENFPADNGKIIVLQGSEIAAQAKALLVELCK